MYGSPQRRRRARRGRRAIIVLLCEIFASCGVSAVNYLALAYTQKKSVLSAAHLKGSPSSLRDCPENRVFENQGMTLMSPCTRGSTSKAASNWPLNPVNSMVWPGLKPLTSMPVEALTNE